MISKKAKNHLLKFIKITIIVLAFYFIYSQLTENKNINWSVFENQMKNKFSFSIITVLILFSILNRFLEILKWKNLVSYIKPISFLESTKQVLASLTTGIITPNGIGEYAGKAFYHKKSESKLIILLNLICNGIQMILTILFGIIGLFILGYYQIGIVITGIGICVFFIVFLTKNFTFKGYSIKKLIDNINEIPKSIHKKNNLYGFFRYLVFSHQYYVLFLIFDVHLPYVLLMSTIAVVYFLASSLPSFQLFDFAVKGSVALYFFGKFDINDWIILFVSTIMWFLNVVIPVFIGSFYVLNFKPKWN